MDDIHENNNNKKNVFFWFPATGWRTSMGTTEETRFSLWEDG
jgi:hypothetical protein